ncbi:hypothetical protein HWV62_39007 [Athelia sp. TMB]|nr:hypothetical protein HWV62_39007 [Athelia sp. TMB]
MAWALNATCEKNVLWLHGVAGAGKSTICTTIVNILRDRECLGGFVFFDRSDAERSNPKTVVRSLAFQLGLFCDSIGIAIAAAINAFPSIYQAPLNVQYQKLLVQPLASLPHETAPIVIVIDSLDECGTPEKRETLLEILAELSNQLPPFIRIAVFSRPEHDIRCAFEERDHVLEHMLDVTTTANTQDIYSYLAYRMKRLRSKMRGLKVPPNWPTEDEICGLTDRASGLFVWAATAWKFIDAFDPLKRMDLILQGHGVSDAEGALDALYRTALESAGSWDDLEFISDFTAVIGVVLVARKPLSYQSIDRLLALSEGRSCTYAIRHLGCVMQQDPTVRLLHPSFGDFLSTRTRCGRDIWHFDLPKHNHTVAVHCMRLLNGTLSRNICNLSLSTDPWVTTLPDEIVYASMYWIDHVCAVEETVSSFVEVIDSFLQRHLVHWLEAMSVMKQSRETIGLLENLCIWLKNTNEAPPSLLELLQEGHRFAQTFAPTIAEHPLLIYRSALPFTPTTSVIYQKYQSHDMPYFAGGFHETWAALMSVFADHEGSVNAACFSPNNSHIASCSSDSTIRIWNAKSGAQNVLPLRGNNNWIWTIAYSPNGELIASGSTDMTIRLWNAKTGAEVHAPFRGHEGWIWQLVFSPDGTKIISCSNDETVRVWDVNTGLEVIPALRGHEAQIYSVAVSPDGTKIASGSTDETIRLWDIQSGKEIMPTLIGHEHWVQTVAFSIDGTRLVSGSDDTTVRIWNIETGMEALPALRGHTDAVKSAVFSPDGKRIVSGSKDRTIKIWDAEAGIELKEFPAVASWVMSVAYSNDGTRIISASRDGNVRIWDAHFALDRRAKPGHADAVRAVSWSLDCKRVASSSYDQTVRVWDAETGEQTMPALTGHEGSVWDVAFTPDGSAIFSGMEGEVMQMWDAQSGAALPVSERGYHFPGESPSGSIVMTDSGWIMDKKTNELISKLPHSIDVLSSAAAQSSQALAIGTQCGRVAIMHFPPSVSTAP